MEDRLLDQGYRRRVIEEIRGRENITRCEESLKDTEVYDGKIRPYVEKELYKKYGKNYTQYPVKASINVVKKVVDSKGSLYREPPTRDFLDLQDEQLEVVERIYGDGSVDKMMLSANKLFELQKQTHLYCVPKKGKLKFRAIKNHNLNVIPDDEDPEVGAIYIFSAFDKKSSDLRADLGDSVNQRIGDIDDYEPESERYYVWSKSYHFVMDGLGDVLSEEIDNPIAPIIPFVEISSEKDFQYWTRKTSEAANFTVDYNASLSDQAQIVQMQGFAQAYLKAPEDLMPSTVMTGPTYLLKLITNPGVEGDVEFGYANPGADLAGVQEYIVSLLSQFLSTQGLDANAINASNQSTQKFASGIERLLALIEKFESSKDAMSLFENAEKQVYKIIVAWLNVLKDTDMLLPEYKTSEIKSDNLSVVFNRPEGSITEMERLDLVEKKLGLGLMSKVDAIMEIENKSYDDAKQKIEDIGNEKSVFSLFDLEGNNASEDIKSDINKDESISND